jgi:CRP/FNR family transcriptional regulator/CRP/FNR family cyclic AMP-dependent transcriptional regulator
MTTRTAGAALRTVERAMAGTPIMESVPARALRDLAAAGTLREYRRGTYLFHQGDDAPDVFFLHDGRVEVSALSMTGHRQLLTTLEGPQFFGEMGVLGDLKRTSTAMALRDSSVWVGEGERFVRFISDEPGAVRALLRALARQVTAHESLVDDLLFLDLKGRVAKRLLGLVSDLEHLPDDGAVVPSVVTHADLASLCGGSRENVTRILSDFQRRKLIARDGRRYVLKNVDGLARLAGL